MQIAIHLTCTSDIAQTNYPNYHYQHFYPTFRVIPCMLPVLYVWHQPQLVAFNTLSNFSSVLLKICNVFSCLLPLSLITPFSLLDCLLTGFCAFFWTCFGLHRGFCFNDCAFCYDYDTYFYCFCYCCCGRFCSSLLLSMSQKDE